MEIEAWTAAEAKEAAAVQIGNDEGGEGEIKFLAFEVSGGPDEETFQ